MTRTEELLAEATAWYQAHTLDVVPIQYVDLQQLIELVRLQHETLLELEPYIPAKVSAIEAFNNFERNL